MLSENKHDLKLIEIPEIRNVVRLHVNGELVFTCNIIDLDYGNVFFFVYYFLHEKFSGYLKRCMIEKNTMLMIVLFVVAVLLNKTSLSRMLPYFFD